MGDADAILHHRRAVTAAKMVIYALLYATPFLVIRDRTLRSLVTLVVPLLITVCAGVVFWASGRAEALQHTLNLRMERGA